MDIKELEILLKGTKYESFIDSLNYVEINGNIYKDQFKIGNKNTGYFVLKVRKNDKKYIFQSIENMAIINDRDNFINIYKEIIEKDDYILMVSDWLNGFQPIYNNNRKCLSKFFSLLGHFNKQNISKGPYTSMYVDSNYFETIDDLLNWEINYHKKYFFEKMDVKGIMEILENLKHGIACIINEDMNCGNLFITDNGEYKIIDTEWIIRGINLYQFQHINYFGFDEENRYNITDEAKECYEAYFGTLGISNAEANEQIRAVELLNVLRENTYLKYRKKDNDKEIEKRIKMVMGKEKYI
jgi:hypothetical protein